MIQEMNFKRMTKMMRYDYRGTVSVEGLEFLFSSLIQI